MEAFKQKKVLLWHREAPLFVFVLLLLYYVSVLTGEDKVLNAGGHMQMNL